MRSDMGRKLAVALSFAAFGAIQALAVVQNVEITAANAYAYSADNPLVCDSGSQITVKHSYRADGRTMKDALIDFIQVTPAADGDPDPWVSVRLIEGGLTNDVDFSEQPYLWLGSVSHGNAYSAGMYDILVGVYEPYGDVYRFGYDGYTNYGELGILVTNLVDNPVTGAPRSIVMRGKGTTCLGFVDGSVRTFTGSVTVEDGAFMTMYNFNSFATTPRVIVRNGANFIVKSNQSSAPATMDVEIDGEVVFYLSGGGTLPRLTLNGSVSGNGTILLKDQGGITFAGTNNTFSGEVRIGYQSNGALPIRVQVGNGPHFSWGNAEFTGFNLPRHEFVLNTHSNVTFSCAIPSNGKAYKMGFGTVTLTQPIDRSAAVAANLPAFVVDGGALVRGAPETIPMEGVMSLASGTAFDLGGIACASCYIPYGGGSIVNPPAGAELVLRGAWTNDLTFAGSIVGNVRLENTGATCWRADSQASLGNVTFADGLFSLDTYRTATATNAITVLSGARLQLTSDEYTRCSSMTGLALDIWLNMPSASSHALFYTNCLAAIGSRVPDVRTDMSLFPSGVHSGEIGVCDDSYPFAKVLGGRKDYFCALFSGYFYAEADGVYSFAFHADDGGAVWVDDVLVTSGAAGNSATAFSGNVELAAGWHPIRMLFTEETGYEIFIVQVKRPGDSAYIDFPSGTLKAVAEGEIRLQSLSGDGEIVRAAGSVWPAIGDATGFTGSVIVDEHAGDTPAGALALNSAQLVPDFDKNMFDGTWTVAQKSAFTSASGLRAILLTPNVASTKGAVNTTSPIALGQPWSVSFDYSAVKPSYGSMGDGFFIGVHNAGATASDGAIFGYNDQVKRLNQPSAYGLQVYIYNAGRTQLVWVNNNNVYAALGPILTNTTLITWNKIYKKPMHVEMSYDGTEKLIVSFSQDGAVLAVTNALAGTDFAAKYADGTAHVGIWGSNGGYFTPTLIERLTLSAGDAPAQAAVLGGALELRGGTVTSVPDASGAMTLAADLRVAGAATLASDGGSLACTSTTWTFDLDAADSSLTVGAGVTLPAAVSLDLSCTGEWPVVPRLLADLSGYSGSLPSFSLSAEVPKSVRLSQSGGKLYVCKSSGTTIIFR